MTITKSDSGRLAKAGGGIVSVYRSEDYDPLTSGVTKTLEFVRDTSSLFIHNRNAYSGGNLYCTFGGSNTEDTPATLAAGESMTIDKAWVTSVTIYSDQDNLSWQVLVTL